MKHFVIVAFLLSSFATTIAQPGSTSRMQHNAGSTQVRRWGADSALILPRFCGFPSTPKALDLWDYSGNVIWDTCNNRIGVWNGSSWLVFRDSTFFGAGVDTSNLSLRVDSIPRITFYGKNASRDSTILQLSNGQRFAAKDSISGGVGVTDGDKGDITVSSTGSNWTIDNQSVTYAKMQNVTDARLLGRSSGSAGSPQEIIIGVGLSLVSGILSASGATSVQTHTSGATVTVNTGVTWLVVNPGSTLSTLAITLPASATNGDILTISFGGTLSTGTVVTTITISANTGQALLQASQPFGPEAGESIRYRFLSSNNTWYRL